MEKADEASLAIRVSIEEFVSSTLNDVEAKKKLDYMFSLYDIVRYEIDVNIVVNVTVRDAEIDAPTVKWAGISYKPL